jgi:hypothetical protein
VFFGFDEDGSMKFSYDNLGFKLEKFINTHFRHVYFPRLRFDESVSREKVTNIVKALFELNFFHFDESIGEISFNEGVVVSIGELDVVVVPSVSEHIPRLLDMVKKSNLNKKNRFNGLVQLILKRDIKKSRSKVLKK